MPLYIDTRGRTKIAIGICGRCSRKFPYDELVEDPNSPGLFVCREDRDQLDPYRLPARETENITLEHPRPDVKLYVGPQAIAIDQPNFGAGPITKLNPSHPWGANQAYGLGDQVTPLVAVGLVAAGEPVQLIFTCIIPGRSGAAPPIWPTFEGVEIEDNTVIWISNGIYLP